MLKKYHLGRFFWAPIPSKSIKTRRGLPVEKVARYHQVFITEVCEGLSTRPPPSPNLYKYSIAYVNIGLAMYSFTHYKSVLLIDTPRKHQETFMFSHVFKGYR